MKIKVETTIEIKPSKGKSPVLQSTDVTLVLSPGLNPADFFNGEKLNGAGVSAVTSVLIQGLVANVLGASQYGIQDQQQHIEFIIKELQRALSAKPTVS